MIHCGTDYEFFPVLGESKTLVCTGHFTGISPELPQGLELVNGTIFGSALEPFDPTCFSLSGSGNFGSIVLSGMHISA